MAPGSFMTLNPEIQPSRRTVFIKCSSDELEMLAHKPHYPDSVFHITLYDGKSSDYADLLLNTLNKFSWNIRVPLSENSKISEINLERRKIAPKNIEYDIETKNLFFELTGNFLDNKKLENLSHLEKIEIIEKVCFHIKEVTSNFEKALEHTSSSITLSASEPSIDDTASWSKKNSDENNRTGLYLTPPELATEITKHALKLAKSRGLDIHFGDPAIGTGVFFSIIQHLLPQRDIKSAIGIELNQTRAKLTEERWQHKGLQVYAGDYLHIDNLPHRTLIIANPPYVRYQNIDSKYSKALREKAILESGINISGQSGLYVYFILASHAWMQKNAIAAWLIPSDFMATNYGHALREYLLRKVQLETFHIYSEESPKFENALVSSCVIIFSNRAPDPEQRIEFSYGGSLDAPLNKRSVSVEQLRSRDTWTFGSIFEASNRFEGPLLGELFEINRGIATGANDYFLLNESDLENFEIPIELTKPVIPKSRYLKSDIVGVSPNGLPNVEPKVFIFDTPIKEEELRNRYPSINRFLDLADSKGVKDRALVRKRKVWTCQEQRRPAPFLVTYMGRGSKDASPIRFIRNLSDAVATNSYLLMYPKPRLRTLLEKSPELYDKLFLILKQVETDILKLHWRKYGGGLKKIEPKDLKNTPIPVCPEWLAGIVDYKLEF